MAGDPLAPLHDFYVTLGGGAAALLGLLFVSVSINVRRIVEHEDTKELARQTFISLVAVLLYALYALLPQPVWQLGVELAGTSGVLVLQAAPRFVGSFVRESSHISRRTQLLRFGLVLLLQLGALAVGVELIRAEVAAASWLIGIEFALLAGAARNSWEMLVEIGAEAR